MQQMKGYNYHPLKFIVGQPRCHILTLRHWRIMQGNYGRSIDYRENREWMQLWMLFFKATIKVKISQSFNKKCTLHINLLRKN